MQVMCAYNDFYNFRLLFFEVTILNLLEIIYRTVNCGLLMGIQDVLNIKQTMRI